VNRQCIGSESAVNRHYSLPIQTAYSLPIHCLFTAYSLPIHCLFTAYSLPIHCLFTAYSLPIHCLLPACSLSIHYLFTVYSLSILEQRQSIRSTDLRFHIGRFPRRSCGLCHRFPQVVVAPDNCCLWFAQLVYTRRHCL
jgi:hypothetical protein